MSLRAGDVLDGSREASLHNKWTLEEWPVDDFLHTRVRLLAIRPHRHFHAMQDTTPFPLIQTNSPLYMAELQTARVAADSLTNTLLLGETGSGKEVLARAIHGGSRRAQGPFLAVNLASLPRELIASELFGYAEGAFTGARKGGRLGKFEAANGGTLFLDEIGELPLEHQVLLLRVLEERTVTRLGAHEENPLDVRIVAATNRPLEKEVAEGRFRADLYYRLNVLTIRIPPLRERPEDIAPLAVHFVQELGKKHGTGPSVLSEDALFALQSHSWPGNVRELRNVVERAFLLAFYEPAITPVHLPAEWNAASLRFAHKGQLHSGSGLLLREMERQAVRQVLAEARSISEAAKKLGIARSTLYRKMGEWGISLDGEGSTGSLRRKKEPRNGQIKVEN